MEAEKLASEERLFGAASLLRKVKNNEIFTKNHHKILDWEQTIQSNIKILAHLLQPFPIYSHFPKATLLTKHTPTLKMIVCHGCRYQSEIKSIGIKVNNHS